MDFDMLIQEWIIDAPYPHIDDQKILSKDEISEDMVAVLRNHLYHIFESENYVRNHYLGSITTNSSNEEIKNVFNAIRIDLGNKFFEEDNSISKKSYEKMINVLIYNCFVH